MDMNIIVAGVGGQGILSIAFVLDNAALKDGLNFKQAEVHGMSQRGGAVQSHMRFSNEEIFSDIIPEGMADMVLSVEPLESLRYVQYLKKEGVVISSASPFVNIPNYPDVEEVYTKIAKLKNHVLIDSSGLAKIAGSGKADNMVMLGAAADLLPFSDESCLEFVELLFKAKGERILNVNRTAFNYGKAVCGFFRAALELGIDPAHVRRLCAALDPESIDVESLPVWKEAFSKHTDLFFEARKKDQLVPGTEAAANEALEKGGF